jgi:transposase-like protein
MATNKQKKRILVPACPDCGSRHAYRRGPGQKLEQRFTCRRCGRHYSPASKPKESGPIKTPCPGCQGTRLFRRGHGDRGVQKYSCQDCGRSFTPGGGRIDPKVREIVKNLIARGLKPGEIAEITGCSYYLAWTSRKEMLKHDNGGEK